MKVIFDFDDVIFNTKKFKNILFSTLETHGYKGGYDKYAQQSKDTPFSLRSFIVQMVADSSEENVEALYEEIMSQCQYCVNESVAHLIEALGKEQCYIVTYGNEAFQRDKIARSIQDTSVQQVVVVPKDKGVAIKNICNTYPDEEIIFVDDRLHFINTIVMEECNNLKTVLFNENGMENLVAEIKASLKAEGKEFPYMELGGAEMKEQRQSATHETNASFRMR